MSIIRFKITLLLLLCNILLFGQSINVTGKVTDAVTNENLVMVNILIQNAGGTTTDLNGNFKIKTSPGKYRIKFSYLGYKTIQLDTTLIGNEHLEIKMYQESKTLGDEIVITASKFEKKVSEEVVSLEIIKPDLISKTNSTRLDQALKKVSGINVADGQASIRGGSGWTYSVGSRVGILVDGQSILTPDRSSIKWKFLPIEMVEQIEIIKGATSVMYGSSSMNGIINLKTIRPTTTPKNMVVSYIGISDKPHNSAAKWWSKPRISSGTYFHRAHKVSDFFEYTIGGNLEYTQLPYQEYNEYQLRGNFNFKWYSKKNPRLNYGFRGSAMKFQETNFIFWQNADSGAYKPNAAIDDKFINFNIDPYINIYDKKENKHEVKSRIYYNSTDFGIQSFNFSNEYTFSKTLNKGWGIISGLNNQFIFAKDPAGFINKKYNANFLGLYLQVDKKFEKISITGGMRAETFKLGDKFGIAYAFSKAGEASKAVKYIPFPMMRFGLNYHPNKNNYIRFNIGQAFRVPSIAEAFVNFEFADLITIMSDPDLKPEYGWTSEVGYKYVIREKKVQSTFDFALFFQKYNDLIEFNVDIIDSKPALVAQNIEKARILGYETSIKLRYDINKKHIFNFDIGYTYTFPVNLNSEFKDEIKPVKSYLKQFFKGMAPINKLNEDVKYSLLKYRNRNLINAVIEYENNHFFTSVYFRYISLIENADEVLGLFIEDAASYYEEKLEKYNGDFVLDYTIGYKHKNHSLSLNIQNLTNAEYSLRLARLEPPRSYNLQYKVQF